MSEGATGNITAASNAKASTCKICTKVLNSKNSLRRHMEVHNEATRYRYRCSEAGCSYSARQKFNLAEHHSSIHLGLKDLNCPYCSYSTGRAANINQHQKRRHPDLPVVSLAVLRTASKSSSSAHTSTQTYPAANRLRTTVSPKLELPTSPYLLPAQSTLELDPAPSVVLPDAEFNQMFDEWFNSEWEPALEFDPATSMVLPDAEFNQMFDEWFNLEWARYISCY